MRQIFVAAAIVFAAAPAFVPLEARPIGQSRSGSDDRLANEHYENGWELLTHEKWDDSAREFQAAIDLNPRFKLAYYGLGRARMGGKHFNDAISAYEACRGMFEAEASQNFANRGDAERIIADDVRQIDMTLSRLQSSGSSPSVLAQIAQLNMMKQRLQNKVRNSDTLSLTTPIPPFVSLALGSGYLRAERFPDAEKAYREALSADPKYGEAHSNLAALYLIMGRYADADREVTAAEKVGFKVNPGLKDDIRKRSGG